MNQAHQGDSVKWPLREKFQHFDFFTIHQPIDGNTANLWRQFVVELVGSEFCAYV